MMWKKKLEPDRPHVTIWRIHVHARCLRQQTHIQKV